MNSISGDWKRRNFLLFMALAHTILFLVVFLNVPFLRQALGFLYFTFVPGIVIIKLLKLDELDRIETILFSVGFSVAFLMFAGLFFNELGPLIGIFHPLSLAPLMIILTSFVLLGAVLLNLRGAGIKLRHNLGLKSHLWALMFICLPILSIAGTIWVKSYESNLILLFLMIAIASLFAAAVISERFLPPKFYSLAIVLIAISLLYHSALISDYLIHFGSDVPGEVFATKIVQNDAHWSKAGPYPQDSSVGRTYAMLSVSLLPVIYSNLINLDSVLVFKILYPIIFSLVPLCLYKVWSKFVNAKYAFASAFFFVSYEVFFNEMLGLNKQIIAELFFALLLLVISSKKMKTIDKTVCYLVFSFALIVSHYALAEIFLIFISFVLISLIVMRRPSRNITVSMVVLFFVMMFCWYLYTSSSAVFDSFISFGDDVYNQLGDFFNPESRGATVLIGLGMEAAPTIWNTISRAFAYLTQALVVIGFAGMFIKRTRIHLELEYFALSLGAAALLAALILVPGLANTLNMTRFYHILLFFLPPFCTLGASTIVVLLRRRRMELQTTILLLVVLIPYFLFQTGFVYELTGSQSYSVPLSKHRMSALRLYTEFGYMNETSIFGARWLSHNVVVGDARLYSDFWSRLNELRGYGVVYVGDVEILSNTTQIAANGIVYLNPSNVVEGIIVGQRFVWNTSEFHFSDSLNKMYSNGEAEVYINLP